MNVTIYTDGACIGNPGPGGWAAIILTENSKKEIFGGENLTTNNRMELTATIKSLEYCEKLIKKKSLIKQIAIYTSYSYIYNCL